MVEAYQQAREKFIKELRFIFPHSSNLIVEINVDNITKNDFEQLPLPYKNETLAGGALNWKSAMVTNEDFTDTFNSEYL